MYMHSTPCTRLNCAHPLAHLTGRNAATFDLLVPDRLRRPKAPDLLLGCHGPQHRFDNLLHILLKVLLHV